MKVVINKCFGGFGLSQEAELAYLARKGKEAFFYAEDRASADLPSDRDLVRVDPGAKHGGLFTYTSTHDFGERVDHATFWNDGGPTPDTYFYDGDLERDDPDLVAIVEELGAAASSGFASLVVVEVPDDAQWEISEYDGLEHVAEAHRTWA